MLLKFLIIAFDVSLVCEIHKVFSSRIAFPSCPLLLSLVVKLLIHFHEGLAPVDCYYYYFLTPQMQQEDHRSPD